ncbi:tetratricopeptide repeat protein [Rodentibacter caecimuris]|uniref:Sel1 repeat family protein n=1 Tax=Rodentibacter caecimuris TaxID=1796644 RepID=A0ABX3L3C8_9PAST|nr:hypothetical protein BKG89_00315 [Rodentibacter heylii]
MKKWIIALIVTTLGACTSIQDSHPQKQSAAHEQAKVIFDQGLVAYQKQEYKTALPLFHQAAAQGFFKAERYIGLSHLNGYGVKKDPVQAFAAFKRASEKDITGQYWLGYCYENAIGTKKDMEKAIYWYQKSAQRGDHISQPAIEALKRLGKKV